LKIIKKNIFLMQNFTVIDLDQNILQLKVESS